MFKFIELVLGHHDQYGGSQHIAEVKCDSQNLEMIVLTSSRGPPRCHEVRHEESEMCCHRHESNLLLQRLDEKSSYNHIHVACAYN